MINPSDILRLIRDEIKTAGNVILAAVAGDNDEETEDIQDLYAGMGTMTDRPVMHPYGFASRAIAKCVSVVARQGAEPQNRVVLGHRAPDRPSDLGEGESCLYSSKGWRIYMRGAAIEIQSPTGEKVKMLAGDLTNTWLTTFLTAYLTHSHASPGAPPTPDPAISDPVTGLQVQLTQGKLLTKTGSF